MATLKGTTNFYDYSVSDILASNLKEMFIYGLIERGAYTIAQFSDTDTSGYTNLQRVTDPRYGDDRVFEGMGPSWVWQSGVTEPAGYDAVFAVSGIWIDNIFYDLNNSTYPYKVDYRNGRILFDSDLSTSGTVACEYVFNDIGVYLSDEPQWKTIVHAYASKFSNADDSSPSGLASRIKENRTWLPSMFIEVDEVNDIRGLQLGGGDIEEMVVRYHIFAEEPFIRNRLVDLVNNQYPKTINLYNINSAPFALDFYGKLSGSQIEYPSLATKSSPYFYSFARIVETNGGGTNSMVDLYRGLVENIIEVDRPLSTF